MARDEIDVLVVGAGPTGLTAAIELARRGVAVSVVDKAPPRPFAESRAEGIHARTLEIFDRQGVLPSLIEHGRVLAGFAFRSGRRRLGELSAGGLDSPHAYALLLPQSEVERLMIARLGELGVTVRRPAEVVGFAQTANSVEVTLQSPDRQKSTLTAKFVVAADGAHSTIRRMLGIAFNGQRLQGAYVMDGQAEFADEPAADRGSFVLGRGGFVVVGRRPDDSYRIAVSLPGRDGRISRDRPELAELQTLLDDFPDIGIRLTSITWSSAFFISTRAVERLRHGRIFLAGDAAHIHSPVGGQGMNTGIQDAVNLAWKLAGTLDGGGGDLLLDSYDEERLPIIRRLLASTAASTKPLFWRSRIGSTLRDLALTAGLAIPALQTKLFEDFTGFDVRYRRGALIPDGKPMSHRRAPAVGDVAPEAPGPWGWYGHWGGDPRHQLLIFASDSDMRDAALRWCHQRASVVRPLTVAPQSRLGEENTVVDPTGALRRRYAATSNDAVYLVRPDGHIAARSMHGDLEPLSRYCRTYLRSDDAFQDEPAVCRR